MIYVPAAHARPAWVPSEKLLRRGVNVGGAIAILASLVSGNGYYVAAGAGLLMIALAAWRWPGWSLVTFAALVPVNRFLLLVFYHLTHSDTATTLAQLWKDGLMSVLLAKVLFDLLFARRKTNVYLLDLVLVTFIALSVAYLVWPGTIAGITFTTRLTGFRADTFFLVAYFVGRGIQLQRRHLRWMFLSLIPGSVMVAVIAVWQFVMPLQANALFEALDFSRFIKTEGATAVRARGLAGQNLPRASSLLGGDLALAFYQLILCSVAAALLFERSLRRHRVLAGAFLVAMIGTLVLTITRSAIIAVGPALAVMALLGRGLTKLVLVLAAIALLGSGAFVATHLEPSTVSQLLSLEEASVVGHEGALERSLADIQADPLGRGFGTAGMVGQLDAFGQGITNENWYLQIATEIGIVPAALYLLSVVAVTIVSLVTYFRVRDTWLRVLTLTMVGAGLGFLIVGNTLHAFEVPVISMLFWLFAGIAVRARELDADPLYLETR
jgi:hypothetical protein